ncbi:MAG: NUDIX domain-containing protein [Anaerolineae bacterium]|nr:MAG: NUDIX domain-containing protein [Anaerolineae bacterium]
MEIELLVRAVIEDDGRFLIAHTKGAGNVYLPGGHVESGEGMKYALARELSEELGATFEVGEYLGAVEHAWEVAGVHSHEVNHFFVATSPELRAIQYPHSQEDHIEFAWLLPSEFEERNLQPAPLRRLLSDWKARSRLLWWASTLEPHDT